MARIMQLDSLPLFFIGGREPEEHPESGFNLSNPNSINPDNMSYEVGEITNRVGKNNYFPFLAIVETSGAGRFCKQRTY
jgi:hypothetical protein